MDAHGESSSSSSSHSLRGLPHKEAIYRSPKSDETETGTRELGGQRTEKSWLFGYQTTGARSIWKNARKGPTLYCNYY